MFPINKDEEGILIKSLEDLMKKNVLTSSTPVNIKQRISEVFDTSNLESSDDSVTRSPTTSNVSQDSASSNDDSNIQLEVVEPKHFFKKYTVQKDFPEISDLKFQTTCDMMDGYIKKCEMNEEARPKNLIHNPKKTLRAITKENILPTSKGNILFPVPNIASRSSFVKNAGAIPKARASLPLYNVKSVHGALSNNNLLPSKGNISLPVSNIASRSSFINKAVNIPQVRLSQSLLTHNSNKSFLEQVHFCEFIMSLVPNGANSASPLSSNARHQSTNLKAAQKPCEFCNYLGHSVQFCHEYRKKKVLLKIYKQAEIKGKKF